MITPWGCVSTDNTMCDGIPCCDGTENLAHRRNVRAPARPRARTDGYAAPRFLRNFRGAGGLSVPALTQQGCAATLGGAHKTDFACMHAVSRRTVGEGAGETMKRGSRQLRNTGLYVLTPHGTTDRSWQRRFHWCGNSSPNHPRAASAPICWQET